MGRALYSFNGGYAIVVWHRAAAAKEARQLRLRVYDFTLCVAWRVAICRATKWNVKDLWWWKWQSDRIGFGWSGWDVGVRKRGCGVLRNATAWECVSREYGVYWCCLYAEGGGKCWFMNELGSLFILNNLYSCILLGWKFI